ncbi:unnamed protein product [Rangifer tarandus platyrhynchus]|uniref:Uncharacterized protein n=2 Tax=Rangifer tarandus platyrhynchus TaxID=3082113 RepID=A0AC59YKF8_RANTA|nr:unnamed protein product [Rangifer tarandus platyrhynchus]
MSLRTGITPLRETPEEKREVPKVGEVENSSIHPRNQIYLDQACDPRWESHMHMGGQRLLPQHLPSTSYLLASLGQQGGIHHTWHCLNLTEGRVQTRGSVLSQMHWEDLQLPSPHSPEVTATSRMRAHLSQCTVAPSELDSSTPAPWAPRPHSFILLCSSLSPCPHLFSHLPLQRPLLQLQSFLLRPAATAIVFLLHQA